MCHDPLLALQTTVSPRSLLLMHAPVSHQPQHHSHRVAMETAERHTPRVRDGERKRDNEGHGERERGGGSVRGKGGGGMKG